ncbi:MAG: hypothetical protein J3R72DRAFT_147229 [Linnemannia gamsii]|nr:MAG: hypothetical protein J3R72DRAFT_147229 [Linnemannia gamsii]
MSATLFTWTTLSCSFLSFHPPCSPPPPSPPPPSPAAAAEQHQLLPLTAPVLFGVSVCPCLCLSVCVSAFVCESFVPFFHDPFFLSCSFPFFSSLPSFLACSGYWGSLSFLFSLFSLLFFSLSLHLVAHSPHISLLVSIPPFFCVFLFFLSFSFLQASSLSPLPLSFLTRFCYSLFAYPFLLTPRVRPCLTSPRPTSCYLESAFTETVDFDKKDDKKSSIITTRGASKQEIQISLPPCFV